jgi:hypothetical protein
VHIGTASTPLDSRGHGVVLRRSIGQDRERLGRCHAIALPPRALHSRPTPPVANAREVQRAAHTHRGSLVAERRHETLPAVRQATVPAVPFGSDTGVPRASEHLCPRCRSTVAEQGPGSSGAHRAASVYRPAPASPTRNDADADQLSFPSAPYRWGDMYRLVGAGTLNAIGDTPISAGHVRSSWANR